MDFSGYTLLELYKLKYNIGLEILSRVWFKVIIFFILVFILIIIVANRKRK